MGIDERFCRNKNEPPWRDIYATYNNKEASDITFIVEDKKFYLHKCVLKKYPILYAMIKDEDEYVLDESSYVFEIYIKEVYGFDEIYWQCRFGSPISMEAFETLKYLDLELFETNCIINKIEYYFQLYEPIKAIVIYEDRCTKITNIDALVRSEGITHDVFVIKLAKCLNTNVKYIKEDMNLHIKGKWSSDTINNKIDSIVWK